MSKLAKQERMQKIAEGNKDQFRMLRFATVLFSSLKQGIPYEFAQALAYYASMGSNGHTVIKDAEKEIIFHFNKNYNLGVKRIEPITSSEILPKSSGSYKITEDIRNYVDKFINKNIREYYLVQTNDDYALFVAKMNERGNKVVNEKNIFSVLDELYRNFCDSTAKGTGLLEKTKYTLDNEIGNYNGYIPDNHPLLKDIAYAQSLLIGAKESLLSLGRAADVYHPDRFAVKEGLINLETLIEFHKGLEQSIASLPRIYL